MSQSSHSTVSDPDVRKQLQLIQEARTNVQTIIDHAERTDRFLDCLEQVLTQDTELTPDSLNSDTFASLPSTCRDTYYEAQAAEYLILRLHDEVDWNPPEDANR